MDTPAATSPDERPAILVADDDDAVRWVTRRLLERAGHAVVDAASGSEATALLQSGAHRIFLVITDVVMPGMSGMELATAIHATNPGLPVLYISGHSLATLEQRECRIPAWGFLQKPFTATALVDRVRELLDTRPGSNP